MSKFRKLVLAVSTQSGHKTRGTLAADICTTWCDVNIFTTGSFPLPSCMSHAASSAHCRGSRIPSAPSKELSLSFPIKKNKRCKFSLSCIMDLAKITQITLLPKLFLFLMRNTLGNNVIIHDRVKILSVTLCQIMPS